jgi:hypothetical protein
MPDGVAPPFAWTFQPGGAHFDAERPVKVEYPNMSGLSPGSIAYFLSFNHDTERFEIAASGHVTDDGATILTDPGSGLTISGWGCNCPPYSVTGECRECPSCEDRARTALHKMPNICPSPLPLPTPDPRFECHRYRRLVNDALTRSKAYERRSMMWLKELGLEDGSALLKIREIAKQIVTLGKEVIDLLLKGPVFGAFLKAGRA